MTSATVSHVGTALSKPRSEQTDGARWAARMAKHYRGPREKHVPIPMELTAIWDDDDHPGND